MPFTLIALAFAGWAGHFAVAVDDFALAAGHFAAAAPDFAIAAGHFAHVADDLAFAASHFAVAVTDFALVGGHFAVAADGFALAGDHFASAGNWRDECRNSAGRRSLRRKSRRGRSERLTPRTQPAGEREAGLSAIVFTICRSRLRLARKVGVSRNPANASHRLEVAVGD
jgi:hypothetical protein